MKLNVNEDWMRFDNEWREGSIDGMKWNWIKMNKFDEVNWIQWMEWITLLIKLKAEWKLLLELNSEIKPFN